jgi:hypothetical protein
VGGHGNLASTVSILDRVGGAQTQMTQSIVVFHMFPLGIVSLILFTHHYAI